MSMINKTAVLFCAMTVWGWSFTAIAGELDQASQEALKKTAHTLTNRAEREKYKKDDAALQKVDDQVHALTGDGKNKDAIYNAAAKILGDLAKESGGDPDKMLEKMQKAQSDPKAFLESLPQEDRNMIRGIAEDIEKVDSKQP